MTPKQFSLAIATYYKEPLLVDGKPNIRVVSIERWATGKEGILNELLNDTLKTFIPTSVNPCPLISHLEQISNKENDLDLARETADRIINAVTKYGYTNIKEAEQYIGEVGWSVVSRYGGWVRFSQELLSSQVEIVRSHLRDSAVTIISRIRRQKELDMPINFDRITNQTKGLTEQKAIK